MVNLSDAAARIVEEKQANWKYLLFAQLVEDDVRAADEFVRPHEGSSVFRHVIALSRSEPLGTLLNTEVKRIRDIARDIGHNVERMNRTLKKMERCRRDPRSVRLAANAAATLTLGYQNLALEALKLQVVDVDGSPRVLLDELRALVRDILEQLGEQYAGIVASIRDTAREALDGRDRRVVLEVVLEWPAGNRLTDMMDDRDMRKFASAPVRTKSMEEVLSGTFRTPPPECGIDGMDGAEFERFCARLLVASGYEGVEVTRGSGDQGVDILCEKDCVTYAIQCKRFESMVGNSAVQEVFAGRQLYSRNVGVVMTSSHFTHAARELADATGVALWDREVLLGMVAAAKAAGRM